jgi:hypothetical protein
VNGLWRDVVSCDPTGDAEKSPPTLRSPAVLKVMKLEHVSLHYYSRDDVMSPRILSVSWANIFPVFTPSAFVCPLSYDNFTRQPYNHRNFECHHRDALVMERLSSSHHLVSRLHRLSVISFYWDIVLPHRTVLDARGLRQSFIRILKEFIQTGSSENCSN